MPPKGAETHPYRTARMDNGGSSCVLGKSPRSPALYLADDIGLYVVTYEATQQMLNAGIREIKAVSLLNNVAKTKCILRGDLVDSPGTTTVDDVPIGRVEDFKYLG
jgi:hypothetical protein